MKIGFDAKRAFLNRSGLGNYSRNTINQLVKYFPDNNYWLYTPKTSGIFHADDKLSVVTPELWIDKKFSAYWRANKLTSYAKKDKLDIYHGLSHELPKGIEKISVKSVVTIHDLIFLRYPELYKAIDRKIYERKFKHSCKVADKIIAISEQTKNDIIDFFGIDPNKIEVVYQGCNPDYFAQFNDTQINAVKKHFSLPQEYLLYVGTIEPRKNLLSIVKAMHHGNIKIPLIVVGRKTNYYNQVEEYIEENKLNHIHFLSNVENEELPVIYQLASIFIYPSIFEGFGIPIIEALASGTPVITSKEGVFPESGGPSSVYVDPYNIEEISESIKKILSDSKYSENMIIQGKIHVNAFKEETVANNIHKVYKNLVKL